MARSLSDTLRDQILASSDPVDVMMLLLPHVQHRIAEAGVDELTETERIVFCMWDLVSEIENGGFVQYFLNSSGDLAREALTSLRLIGAPRTAALLQRVMARLGEQATSRDRDTRAQAIGRTGLADDGAFEEEDNAFYAHPESLWALTVEYCREHRDQLRVTE